MLKYVQKRNGNLLSEMEVGVFKAIKLLVENEFKWSGVVTSLSNNHIEVETKILGKLDTILVDGDPDELAPLVTVAKTYMILRAELSTSTGIDAVVNYWDSVTGDISGHPAVMEIGMPLIVGERIARILMVTLLGTSDVSVRGLDLDELVNIYELMLTDNLTAEEAISYAF